MDDRDESLQRVEARLLSSFYNHTPTYSAHVERVADESLHVSDLFGFPQEERELLYHGAKMHDIGKLLIPKRILDKPGELTPAESRIMALHARLGSQILKSYCFGELAPFALYHHENVLPPNLDPIYQKLIPIVTALDSVDAGTHDRAYSLAQPHIVVVGRIKKEHPELEWLDLLDDAA